MALKFKTKCEMLSILSLYRDKNPEYAEFVRFYDLGLPYASGISHGDIDKLSKSGIAEVNKTWLAFLDLLGVSEDDLDDDLEFFEQYYFIGGEFD